MPLDRSDGRRDTLRLRVAGMGAPRGRTRAAREAVVVEGAGHGVQGQKNPEMLEAVRAFVASLR